jgi:hypothetical protein
MTRLATLALAAVVASGCTVGVDRSVPDLGGLYDRAAQVETGGRNPVVVIPGVLGSRLRDRPSGRTVWGAFAGRYANPRTADGARLVALPMREGAPLAELRDDVEPEAVLDRVRVSLFGLPVEQQAYVHILATLGVGGYRDETLGRAGAVRYADGHFTCFQFPYDWRRDNAENARRLHEFLLEKKAYVEAEIRRRTGRLEREVRFDVVAHSMGGLLLRYYLRYGTAPLPGDGSLPPVTWAGAALVERAVLVGTPNAGSAEALRNLVDGASFSFVLPRYAPAILGTMPALYELLPRARHAAVVREGDGEPVDLLDPATWERFGWGLASPGEEAVIAALLPEIADPDARRRVARDHLRKSLARATQFHAALDRPAVTPESLSLHLFAGDSERTAAVLAVAPDGALSVRAFGPGDGTVLRTSALLDERVGGEWRPEVATPVRWDSVTFVFADHLGLTRDAAFTDNLLYRLLEMPRLSPVGASATRADAMRRAERTTP